MGTATKDPRNYDEKERGGTMGDVVVGVDGSPGSIEAARFALEEASLRSLPLRLICCYQSPAAWLGMGEALGSTVTATVSESDLAGYATETIDAVLAALATTPDLTIIKEPVEGHAGAALVNASATATLLVVGSRGHSDFTSALLGSTGMHCVHHAACPVVVIPAHKKK